MTTRSSNPSKKIESSSAAHDDTARQKMFELVQKLFGQIPMLPLLLLIGVYVLVLLLIAHEVRQWPYIGAQFSSNPHTSSLLVSHVTPDGPAAKAGLVQGDRIVQMELVKTLEKYNTTGLEAIAGRHQLSSYDQVTQTGIAIAKAWDLISHGPVIFHTTDGKKANLTPLPSRPLATLPSIFYTAIAQSFLVLMIASGIYFFAVRTLSVSLLTLSGLGLSTNMLTNSVLATRELVISPEALLWVTNVNAIASVVFIYSLLALLWHFPSRINAFPFVPLVLLFGLLILAIQQFQLFEFPIHAFQIPNLLPFPLAIAISFIQWRRSRYKPVERASIMWFMLSIYGVTTLVVLFYSVPILFGFPPLIGPHTATFALSFIYIGVAFGTLKFRLFDINTIWWKSIVWLLGGLVVFLVDILLIVQFDLEQAKALPLALFLAGWVYFPLRQAVVGYFIGSREVKLATYIPDFIDTFSSLDEVQEFEGRFVAFLSRVFVASDIVRLPLASNQKALLCKNGLILQVPKLAGTGAVELVGKASGRQLFSSNDARIADGFTRLARNMMDAHQREKVKLSESRDQIVRDLHDDVGGKLLSLILKAKDQESVDAARKTLAALKESLIAVENTQTVDTSTMFDQIVQETRERLGEAGQSITIQQNVHSNRILTAREYINLKRISQEIVSNWIKYATPDTATMSLGVSREGLIEITATNKTGAPMANSSPSGRGLANIERRAMEIGATLEVDVGSPDRDESQFSIVINIPIAE